MIKLIRSAGHFGGNISHHFLLSVLVLAIARGGFGLPLPRANSEASGMGQARKNPSSGPIYNIYVENDILPHAQATVSSVPLHGVMSGSLIHSDMYIPLPTFTASGSVVHNTLLLGVFLIPFLILLPVVMIKRRRKSKIITIPAESGTDYAYIMTVTTGLRKDAGTNAKIDVQLYSETSSSARYRLSAYDTEQPILKRGNKDMFLVYTQAPLGKMSHVVINQKGKGKKAKWHLDNIKLYDPLEEQEWTFPCNIWLKPAHNGGEETHCVCFQSEQTRTSWLFNTITSNLLQFHLWVNAVFGGPREHPCILSRPLTVLTLFSLYVNYLLGNILLTVAFPQPASGEKQLVSGDLFIIAFGVHFVIKLLNCLVEFTLCNTVTKRLCWMYDILNMDPLGWTDKPDTGGGGRISMARQACRDAPPDDEEAFILSGDADIPASVGVEDDTMVSISHGQYLVEAEIHHGASPSEVLDTADIPVELTYTACGGEQKLEEFKPSAIPKVARGSVSAKDSQLNLSNTLLVDKPQPLLSAWQPSDMPFEEMDEMPTKALSSHAIISPIPPSAGPGKRQRRHTMVFNREEMPFSRQVSLASKTELMRQNLAKKRLGHMDVETSTARVCQDIRLQRSQSDTSILQTNDNINNSNGTSGGPETGNTNMTARDDASAISAHDNVVQQGSMVDGAINQDSMATVFESAYAVLHLEDDDGSPGDDLKKPSLTSTQQLTDAQLLQLEMEATGEMKKKLPHYVLYIIIVLLLCSVFISLFFTEIYMIELTTESSYRWACLVVFALLEEVFIFEPLKVASVVIYRAVFPAANNR